jgi:hypothetical protein
MLVLTRGVMKEPPSNSVYQGEGPVGLQFVRADAVDRGPFLVVTVTVRHNTTTRLSSHDTYPRLSDIGNNFQSPCSREYKKGRHEPALTEKKAYLPLLVAAGSDALDVNIVGNANVVTIIHPCDDGTAIAISGQLWDLL